MFFHRIIFLFLLISCNITAQQNTNVTIDKTFGENKQVIETCQLLMDSAKYKLALNTLSDWQKNLEQSSFSDSLAYAESYRLIGICNGALSKHKKAISNFEKSYDLKKNLLGESSETAQVYVNQALIYRRLGRSEKAFNLIMKADSIQQIFREKEWIRFDTFIELAVSHENKEYYDKASDYAEKALTLALKYDGEKNISVALAYFTEGYVRMENSNKEASIKYFNQAIDIIKQNYDTLHPLIASAYNNLGVINNDLFKYNDALKFHTQALQIRLKNFDSQHEGIAYSYSRLGWTYFNLRQIRKSINYHSKALEIRKFVFGNVSPPVAGSLSDIGDCYEHFGLYHKAISFHNDALDIIKKCYGQETAYQIPYLIALSSLYDKKGDKNKYLAVAKVVLALSIKHYDENSSQFEEVYSNLSSAYISVSDFEKAAFYFNKAEQFLVERYGADSPIIKLLPVINQSLTNPFAIDDTVKIRKMVIDLEDGLNQLQVSLAERKDLLGLINIFIGYFYTELNENRKSIKFFKKAEELYFLFTEKKNSLISILFMIIYLFLT